MVTCMSWRMSSGSTKRVVAQRPSVPGIGIGAMSCSLAKEGLRDVDAFDGVIGLADPVEADSGAGSRCERSSRSPAAGRHSRPAAGTCFSPPSVTVSSPSMTNRTPSAPASGSGRSLPPPGATSMMYCEKRLGEARQRPRQHPDAGLVPERQGAGDDVAHHPFRDDGIGLGEHGAAGQQLASAAAWPPCGA